MEEDIEHFISKICSCVKKKPAHIKPVAPFGTVTTIQPMETVSIEFLHLHYYSGGYDKKQQETKYHVLHQKGYSMTLSKMSHA